MIERELAVADHVGGHFAQRPRIGRVVHLEDERVGLLAETELGRDEGEAVGIAPSAPGRARGPVPHAAER